MKKLLALLLIIPSLCFGLANDMIMSQRNTLDTGVITRIIPFTATDSLFWYDGTQPRLLNLGTGLSVTSGTLNASNVFAYPTIRTLSLATAYQCTDNTKPCHVTLTLTSTANLTLTAGTTNTADLLIGPTSAVATGTGTVIAKYRNSITGALVVGLGINTDAYSSYALTVPAGAYFAARQTAGTVSIVSAYEQAIN